MTGSGSVSQVPRDEEQVVLLDVGGVLLLPDPDVVARALRPIGIAPDVAASQYAHYQATAVTDVAGTVARGAAGTSYWREYARACGVPTDLLAQATGHLTTAFREDFGWWQVIPGSREALAELADQVTVALVSNGDGRVESALRELQVCQVGAGPGVAVSAIIDSGIVGVGKPDPRIFTLTLEQLGIAPSRALHVGDTLRSDIDGARNAGIRPLHLAPHGCPDARDGHDHVTHLCGVLAALHTPWAR
jgi:putative hydrolase of the HAD superfamily